MKFINISRLILIGLWTCSFSAVDAETRELHDSSITFREFTIKDAPFGMKVNGHVAASRDSAEQVYSLKVFVQKGDEEVTIDQKAFFHAGSGKTRINGNRYKLSPKLGIVVLPRNFQISEISDITVSGQKRPTEFQGFCVVVGAPRFLEMLKGKPANAWKDVLQGSSSEVLYVLIHTNENVEGKVKKEMVEVLDLK